MVVVSLEVSTTTAKCILFSVKQGVIAEASRRYGADVADGPSQDPQGIFSCALDVLRQMVQAADDRGLAIEAIGLTGIWHSLLLVDGERQPVERIRTWVDLAGADHISAVRRDEELVRSCYHKTGCMVHAVYPAWKWHYLKYSQPELTEKARYISSQMEYVFESLTGEMAVSKSIASGTGFFNIHTLDWDTDVLDIMGLAPDQLGELVEAFHTAPLKPEIAQLVGLPSGVPVTVGCADGAMNQLAIGGLGTEAMSMSVGTSGALRVVHLEPRIPEEPSTWCYYLLGGRRLAGAAVNNGTNCVDWFLTRHGGQLSSRVYDRFSEGIMAVDRTEAPVFMPFLFGERCPGWKENRTGGFVDVKATHGEYALYYSILEGVLFNMRQCYDILVEVGGRPQEVLVSGGIVNSAPWMQMAADILQRE
ncbi:MAG: hypothetical protein GX998_06805, partial [Firmicutes bacterium]|nr:hypothetical protein [Bacillota bacterium]